MSPVKALPPPAAPAAQAPPAKEKVVPPSPPMLIKDKERGSRYTRIGFLGEVSVVFACGGVGVDGGRAALPGCTRCRTRRRGDGRSRSSTRPMSALRRTRQRSAYRGGAGEY